MSQNAICDEAEKGNAATHLFEPTGYAIKGDKSWSILNEAHRQPSNANINESSRILIYTIAQPTGNSNKDDTEWTSMSLDAKCDEAEKGNAAIHFLSPQAMQSMETRICLF